jgi:hypothetical protein
MSSLPETPLPSGRWAVFLLAVRRNAVALFATFHIVCVLLYALPNPPVSE